jgi:hypothetical protein
VESLRRGLRATAGVGLAVFCALVGAGSWLVGSPAPPWFPWRGAWIAGLLLVAGALLAVFRREIAPSARSSPSAAGDPAD